MKPALIFDFGNVIAFFDYRKALKRISRPFESQRDDLLKIAESDGLKSLVVKYESGLIGDRAFHDGFLELAKLRLEFDEFAAAWSDIFTLNESVASLIPPLKSAGYTLVLGSNTNALHALQFQSQFRETLAHFDAVVLSYEIGHVKPTVPFYLACAKAAQRPPGDCIFIDDLSENVQGAIDAGLKGIRFQSRDDLITELAKAGVQVAF